MSLTYRVRTFGTIDISRAFNFRLHLTMKEALMLHGTIFNATLLREKSIRVS